MKISELAADLLLRAGAIHPNPSPVELPAPDDPRWSAIVDLAWKHGMRPLLARYLRTCHPDSIPPGLNDFVAFNLRSNLRKTGALIDLLRIFQSHSMPVIAYKGPALADLAYGCLDLREFADLDLLIAKEDLVKCRELLESIGYRSSLPLDTSQLKRFAAQCNVLDFWKEETQISVEIHWALSPKYLPFSPTFEAIDSRAILARPGGHNVRTMSIEATLLYLSLHGAKHGWERLSWICDVGWLLHRHPEIDWDLVLAEAQHCHSQRILRIGLLLASKVTGLKLPAHIQKSLLADPFACAIASEIIANLFADSSSPASQARLIFRMLPTLPQKLRSAWFIAFTPSAADWIAFPTLPLPPFSSPLLRLLRLIKKVISRSTSV